MKLHDIESEKVLWIVLALLLLLVAFNSFLTVFNSDEFVEIHTSWKVLNSGHIYTDFFQNHHPLLYLISAPIIALTGENTAALLVFRGMALGILLATLLVIYLIGAKLFDKKTALLSVVLLASMRIFIHRAIEVRTDTPQVLFGLISILFLLSFFEKRSRRDLVFSGVALAISFMFLQKALLLILILGAIMVVDIFRRNLSVRDLLLYSLVFIITLVPLYAYVLATGEFETYILLNWKLNLNMEGGFSPLSNIFHTLRRNTLVWIFYFAGLWLVIKAARRDSNRVRLAVLSITLLASVFLASHPNPQYFMHSVPLITVLAAFALTTFFSANPRRLLIIVIIGSAIPAFAIAKRPFKKPNTQQIERVAYALSITDKTDRVHDTDKVFNFFREDINYNWSHGAAGEWLAAATAEPGSKDYGKRLCERIRLERPALISDHMLTKDCRYLKSNYKRSKKHKDIFIRVNRN